MTRSETRQKSTPGTTTKKKPEGEKSEASKPPVGVERHTVGESLERFGWDIFGVILIGGGLILFLGVLRLTSGNLIDSVAVNLDRLFGYGRFILPLIMIAVGCLGMLWRKGQAKRFTIGRLIALELAFFMLLGAVSAFSGDLVEHVRINQSFAGLVGWGIAHPLQSLLGWLPTGLIFSFLTLILLLVGFDSLGGMERWARRQAGLPEEATDSGPVSLTVHENPRVVAPKIEVEPLVEQVTTHPPVQTPRKPLKTSRGIEQIELFGNLNERPQGKKTEAEIRRSNELPPLTLLDEELVMAANQSTINMNAGLIEKTLAEFGIPAKVVGYRVGPTVTQFAVEPGYIDKGNGGDDKQKVRISQISGLNRDLALALKAERLRIEAPVPGESYVGIEVPNATHAVVRLRPMLESPKFIASKSKLTIPLGRDVSGQPLVSDLATMPHLLIAGTTNSGKSICIAAITTCLVMNNRPDELKLVMIDPKMVELNRFNGLPHLWGQVETNVERIMSVLRWATTEMDYRYKLLETVHARNLDTYNDKMEKSGKQGLPRIVIIIDELADLMMSAQEVTQNTLVRLAQKARAVGMHLIVATQRPSTDIITGVIKANFPTRIAFTVASMVDSRVILDTPGAESLLGKGDMLFLHPEIGIPKRSQGVLVSDNELQRVIRWWNEHTPSNGATLPVVIEPTKSEPESHEEIAAESIVEPETEPQAPWEETIVAEAESSGDEGLIRQAVKLLKKDRRASASYFQRQLRIGYPKAAWLVDTLEARGILGPAQSGGKEREILLDDDHQAEE
ncbi:MAG: DNA translocase FtsK [Anaerolineaceae bacterium]